jgi:hypothetical protein
MTGRAGSTRRAGESGGEAPPPSEAASAASEDAVARDEGAGEAHDVAPNPVRARARGDDARDAGGGTRRAWWMRRVLLFTSGAQRMARQMLEESFADACGTGACFGDVSLEQ